MLDFNVLREKVLSDCQPQQAFWTCHGSVLRNIYELVDFIKTHNIWAFLYHVNEDHNKNDFADWIKNVLGDEELANRLQHILDKDRYADIIDQRIKEFENS